MGCRLREVEEKCWSERLCFVWDMERRTFIFIGIGLRSRKVGEIFVKYVFIDSCVSILRARTAVKSWKCNMFQSFL